MLNMEAGMKKFISKNLFCGREGGQDNPANHYNRKPVSYTHLTLLWEQPNSLAVSSWVYPSQKISSMTSFCLVVSNFKMCIRDSFKLASDLDRNVAAKGVINQI